MSAPVVTREDAFRFCKSAMRNWQYVIFNEDELEDLRIELERHRTEAEAAANARVAELVEALEQIAEPAMVPLDELPNGWRAVAVERIDIARTILARTKVTGDAQGEGA